MRRTKYKAATQALVSDMSTIYQALEENNLDRIRDLAKSWVIWANNAGLPYEVAATKRDEDECEHCCAAQPGPHDPACITLREEA